MCTCSLQYTCQHLCGLEANLTAIDDDNGTVEEKRVGMMEKWKERFSFRATYRVFVE